MTGDLELESEKSVECAADFVDRNAHLRHSAHERGCFFVFLSSCLGRLLACMFIRINSDQNGHIPLSIIM